MFKKTLIGLLAIIIAILIGTVYGKATEDEVTKLDSATKIENLDEEELDNKIYVYVTGAVNRPGMVALEKDKLRVADAVNACGGLLPTADVDNFNMAETISDGQHIRIPEKIIFNENQPINQSQQTNQTSNSNNDNFVNINTADVNELQKLNGIGPAMAQRIIDYRQSNGSFKSVEDIQKVKGIGVKKFEKIKAQIKI